MSNTLLRHEILISPKFGELEDYLDWCTKSCVGNWNIRDDNDGYIFSFDQDNDYAAFVIWKS